MVAPADRCDESRLRLLLDDRLADRDHAVMCEHLDLCAACRSKLERMAAGSGLWASLPGLAHGDEPTPAHGIDAAAELDQSLDFLDPPDEPGTLGRLGPYRVTEILGRGGFGIVLKAIDPGLGRAVAIKVLSPRLASSGAARGRFAREAKAAAAVVHDHVVAIHSVDSWNGLPYLVMPYIAGWSLQERVDRDGPLGVKEVLRIGMQTALGLTAAHHQGLVHRDVKPSNILLENGVERVKLTDFGLARAVDDASLTQSGVVAGTPQYMSPEQANGEVVDHRSDLFSLGSVLYFMCAGHPPFRANSTPAVLKRVCDDQPRNLRDLDPEIPAWLAQIIERLHAKDWARRFQSAEDVALILGNHLASLQRGTAIGDPQPVARPARGLRLGRKTAAAGLFLGTGALVALIWPSALVGLAPPARQSQASSNQGSAVIITGHPEAQIVGSGIPATKPWPIADFSSIRVESTFQAEISLGQEFKVIATADDNVLEHVRIIKDGTTLVIGLAPNTSYRLKTPLKAEITLPTLVALDQSGSSKALLKSIKSDKPFRLRVSGASRTAGAIEAPSADFQLGGSSTVSLTGSARSASLSVEGASHLQLADFPLGQCQLDVSGSSSIALAVKSTDPLRAKVQGASTLTGSVETPEIDLSVHGSSVATLHGASGKAKLAVDGASHLRLADLTLNADQVVLSADGSSTATLAGKCRAAVVEASGASRLDLTKLATDALDVTLSSSSTAKVDVRSRLKYDLSSAANLTYSGNPASLTGTKSSGARISGR